MEKNVRGVIEEASALKTGGIARENGLSRNRKVFGDVRKDAIQSNQEFNATIKLVKWRRRWTRCAFMENSIIRLEGSATDSANKWNIWS